MVRPVDPLFSQVRLLMHCNGTTGLSGETVYDSSSYAHTLTTAGVVDTLGNGKFGSGGLYTSGGGGGNSRVITPTTASLSNAGGSFTLDFWLNPGLSMLAGNMYFLAGNGSTADIWAYITSDYKLGVNMLGSEWFTMPGTLVGGQWYFVRLVYDSVAATVKVFLNGALLYQNADIFGATLGATAFWEFLSAPSVAGGGVGERCFLDEIRFTTAVRPGTEVPTAAFPDA